MNISNSVDLSSIYFEELPFAHFYSPSAFLDDTTLKLLEWFEKSAPWKLVEADFYDQYEFSLMNNTIPELLDFLGDTGTIGIIRKTLTDAFRLNQLDLVEISAHKLIAGQSIRIHNDYIDGEETHRFIVHINSGWNEEDGGLFILFNSSTPEDIAKIFKPLDNSAIGFEISQYSNHAVSKVYGTTRYSLIYTFKERASQWSWRH